MPMFKAIMLTLSSYSHMLTSICRSLIVLVNQLGNSSKRSHVRRWHKKCGEIAVVTILSVNSIWKEFGFGILVVFSQSFLFFQFYQSVYTFHELHTLCRLCFSRINYFLWFILGVMKGDRHQTYVELVYFVTNIKLRQNKWLAEWVRVILGM